jgi:polyhydroxyalkanoate synthesis regulator phasin
MMETFKKTVLAGIGAAVVTKEKVQAGLEDFVKQGKVTAADARAMAEKIAEQGRREFDDASSKLGDRARDFLSSFDHKYAARIEALEERVAALEGKAPKETSRRARP